MEDVPHDLRENWVMMVYPQGRRCVVVSGRGNCVREVCQRKICLNFELLRNDYCTLEIR